MDCCCKIASLTMSARVKHFSSVESGEAPWQQGGAPSVGEEAEVADADEALGEQVK
jgi:hypothetical protein